MLLVSTDAVFVRLSGTSALNLAWLSALFSLPVCLLLNRRYEHLGPVAAFREHPLPLLILASLFAFTQLCFLASIEHTLIANTVAIVAAGPVFVAVGARLFLRERTSTRVWTAIVLSLVGILMIVAPSLGSAHLLGDSLALLTICCFSVSLLVLRRYPMLSRYLVFSFSAMIMLLICVPWLQLSELPLSAWLCAASMGLLFNTGGRVLYANAPRFAPSSEVALFNPVETVAATGWAWWLFAETPTGQSLLGTAIIIGAVFYGSFASRARHSA